MKKVFIIYGRDLQAYSELVKLVTAIGLQQISFDDVAGRSATNFIADIVTQAIVEADVVVALFTPDEQAALYDPVTAAYRDEPQTSRWQARPNVIFEAGLASGIGRQKTIIATLGTDVQLSSDLHGIYFVDLAGKRAKEIFRSKVQSIVGSLSPEQNWSAPEVSGDFAACLRPRWRHYDELCELEHELRHQKLLERREISAWHVLVRTVSLQKVRSIQWDRLTSRDFMALVNSAHERDVNAKKIVDNAYWWFVVCGLIAFNNIDIWFTDDETWLSSVEYTELSKRGQRLLMKVSGLLGHVEDSVPDLVDRQGTPALAGTTDRGAGPRILLREQLLRQASLRNAGV